MPLRLPNHVRDFQVYGSTRLHRFDGLDRNRLVLSRNEYFVELAHLTVVQNAGFHAAHQPNFKVVQILLVQHTSVQIVPKLWGEHNVRVEHHHIVHAHSDRLRRS